MTTINFPANPPQGATYTFQDRSWIWNGRAWQSKSIFVGYTGSASTVIGYTGSLGFTGSKGADGTSVRIVGAAGTFSELPVPYTGEIGDGYITQDNGRLNVWDGSVWINVGQITGFTGSQGDVGFAGSAGANGVIGVDGAQGETGFTGSAGVDGVIGFTGSQGDIGYTGSQGAGFTGSQGDIGFAGFTGSQGDIGFTGSTGGFDSVQDLLIVTSISYTLNSADIGKLIAFDNTDQIDVTIPNDSAFSVGIGQRLDIAQYNEGPVVIVSGAGVSVYSPFDAFLNEQYAVASLVKIGSNEWIFVGPQAAGFTGSRGYFGYTGSIGFTGSIGDIGYTGSIGGFNSIQIIKEISAESYSLVDSDTGKILILSNVDEDTITVTVPTNAVMPWAVGQRVDLRQATVAPIQVAGAVGTTILSTGNTRLFEKDSVATLIKTATDEWVYVGPQSGYTGSIGVTGSIGFTGSIGPLATRDMYTFGGNGTPEAGTNKIPYLRIAANTVCINASLTARIPPVGGNFVVVIERSSNGGVSFTSTVVTVTLPADTIVTVVTTTISLSAGDILRLNILSVNGAQDWACQLQTQST